MNKNIGSFLAFNELWFAKNQRLLLWLLNAPVIKVWFRWVLRIHQFDCSLDTKITEIGPNRFTWGDRLYFDRTLQEWRLERTSDFRTHPKFGKRLYYAFRPVWWVIHFWDWAVADRFIPALSYGFATLTAYPDPYPESTTTDGYVEQNYGLGGGQAWSTIRSAAGNSSGYDDGFVNTAHITIVGDGASKWRQLRRSIYLFATSSIGSSATVSDAVLSIYGTSKVDEDSISPTVDIYTATPAANTSLANGDYAQTGATSQTGSPITYSGWNTAGYNDFTFNSTGRGNVSKTGISKFSLKNANYDADNSAPGSSTSGLAARFNAYYADRAGTSEDPKLVVTYSNSTAYSQTLSETTTLTDSLIKQGKKVLSETVSHADSVIKSTAKATLSETLSLLDTLLKRAGKVFSETSNSTDTLAKKPGKTFSDTVTSSDTLTTFRTFLKTLTEAITHTDTVARKAGKNLTETVTHTDTVNKTVTKTAFTETTSLTDTLAKRLGRIVSESFSLTDTLLRTGKKVLSETITAVATFTSSFIGRVFYQVVSETVSLADTLQKRAIKILSETLTLTDRIRKLLNGISTFYSDKLSGRGTSYSDKNSARGTSYTDKNSTRGTSYSDKYPPLDL